MMPLGIIFLTLGILMFFRPVIELFVKLQNSMRGIETKITTGTIITYRIFASIWILFSLLLIFGWIK